MDKKLKGEIVEEVVEAMKDVFMPEFERIHNRLGNVEERFANVETTLERMERRENAVDERLDRHSIQLKEHDKKIVGLEMKS